VRLKQKPAINHHALFRDGLIEVQDEGSQLLAWLWRRAAARWSRTTAPARAARRSPSQ
jgi:16S rRNA C967 or C1407 C5-methylase (RsmB/RsmF family)